ncbi:ATPase [Enterococcus faecalis]|uniref:ATPase n=1 Tax=Enterococcus faecalis TaxID=1351 RepID=UPI001A96A7F4|nr:ATPase [Enterococcus faecalis]MBO1137590.1 ATPase [Enterococcus faecalis]
MKLYDFLKLVFFDLYSVRKVRKSGKKCFKEFGLRLYSGCQGSGKTMSLVEQLERYRVKYPDLFIATNFGYVYENASLVSLKDIPLVCKIARENDCCGVVVGWDEIQNDFDNSTRSFPISILRTITQQRKQGIKILATSQVFTRVAKPIREQTFEVVECSTLLERWTFQRWYKPIEYEYYINNPDRKNKIRSLKKYNFIQTNELRELYDSFSVIDSLLQIDE